MSTAEEVRYLEAYENAKSLWWDALKEFKKTFEADEAVYQWWQRFHADKVMPAFLTRYAIEKGKK